MEPQHAQIIMKLIDITGALIARQLTKPDYDAQAKIWENFYRRLKEIDERRERERKGLPEIPRKEVKEETKGTACLPCVTPDTIVFTNPEAKCISEIQEGDKVLDAYGEFTTVIEVMKRRYDGEIISIYPAYRNDPIFITPEHPVLCVEAQACPYHQGYCVPGKDNPKCKNCEIRKKYQPKYIPAGRLYDTPYQSGYANPKIFLLIPRLKEVRDIDEIEISKVIDNVEVRDGWAVPIAHVRGYHAKAFYRREHKDKNGVLYKGHYVKQRYTPPYKVVKGIPVKNRVKIDKSFMKLVGFYLAEGHVTFLKRGGSLLFSFGKHERDYVEEVRNLLKEVFGVDSKVENKETAYSVIVCSSILSKFFAKLFGKRSPEKRIPLWILLLPIEKQVALLEGYFKGDGYKRKDKYNNISASTVSRQLAFAISTILYRLGIIHALYTRKNQESVIDGRVIKPRNEVYVIDIWGPSAVKLLKMMGYETIPWKFKESHLAGIDENYIYLPIKKLERTEYHGIVMNLQTASATYTANGIIVHNCSRDHFSTVSASLNEAVRFARREGINHPEVLRRIGIALDELNIMERIDLAPENLTKLSEEERKIAKWALIEARELRHIITDIESVEDLEKVAAKASEVRTKFLEQLWSLTKKLKPEEVIKKICTGLKGEEKEKCERAIKELLEKGEGKIKEILKKVE